MQIQLDGAHFCVNNGRCHNQRRWVSVTKIGVKSIASDFVHAINTFMCLNRIYNCTCPQGYKGNYCEFEPNATLPPEQIVCKTECQNGGECREGGKDFGMLNTLNGVDTLKK
jgi:hypothetical protein